MKIKIDEQFSLQTQEFGYDLLEVVERTSKEGVKYSAENVLGYNMNFESALKKVIKIKLVRNEEVVELKDFLKKYEELETEFKNKFSKIKD